MKKCFLIGLLAAALLVLTACGQQAQPEPEIEPELEEQEPSIPAEEALPPEAETLESVGEGGALVIYFSATGSTEAVAGTIVDALGAETYEITPAEPYTSDDLNWRDESSRVTMEHENPDSRPALGGELPDLDGYSTVFLGYPIWWGEAPNIVRTFLESVDLSGKTVIPFCTSSSSGLGESAEHLHSFAPDAAWQEGQRFLSQASAEEVTEWVNSLGITE